MKSAYELAMERLEKKEPTRTLTDEQKAQVAELDSLYQSKLAERETFLKGKIDAARMGGQFSEVETLQDELSRDLASVREEWEARKAKLRESFR